MTAKAIAKENCKMEILNPNRMNQAKTKIFANDIRESGGITTTKIFHFSLTN